MAIHPRLHSQASAQGTLTPQQALAISAWTEQAAASLQNLTLSETVTIGENASGSAPTTTRSALRGTSVSLTIPLDDQPHPTELSSTPRLKFVNRVAEEPQKVSVSFRRREPLRRDSLKRREALLKGKDGSRRRQRWENDRLLHNPWAQPPSASDWEIQPSYTRHDPMPYYLAPLWDVKYSHRDRTASKQTPKGTKDEKSRISKEVRMRLKHARAARGMLQDLEEDIRHFIKKWNEKQLMLQDEGLADAPTSSEDEESEDEVVFVGRNGQMHDSPARKKRLQEMQVENHKMVFESHVDDRAAGFGRWLVHSIASYYGLHTWSVTVDETARREAYVGFHPPTSGGRIEFLSQSPTSGATCRQEAMIQPGDELPRPLWTQV